MLEAMGESVPGTVIAGHISTEQFDRRRFGLIRSAYSAHRDECDLRDAKSGV